MFRKILGALGLGKEPRPPADATRPLRFRPYPDEQSNFVYNLLFCDDVSLFGASGTAPWLDVLRSADPDPAALRAIADDGANHDSRIRTLAFNRLREMGEPVPEKLLLGVIFEIGLDGGLDTVAAFEDGGVRYINHTGRMAFVEGRGHALDAQVDALLAASRPVLDVIEPWTEERLPPPSRGEIRMSFLVSDGLYFGEGPEREIGNDPLAMAIMSASFEILQGLVRLNKSA